MFGNLLSWICGWLICHDGMFIKWIKNPTERQQMIAVDSSHGFAIKHIKKPTIAVQRYILTHYQHSFGDLQIVSPEIQEDAVRQNYILFRYFADTATPYVRELVLQENPVMVDCMKEVEFELQCDLVKKYPTIIAMMQNPHKDLVMEVIEAFPNLLFELQDPPDEDMIIKAIQSDCNVYHGLRNPSQRIQEEFVMARLEQ